LANTAGTDQGRGAGVGCERESRGIKHKQREVKMLFRTWFYVYKAGVLLFALCGVSFLAETRYPTAEVATKAALMFLIPIAFAGASLGAGVFIFGMKFKCPCCNSKETSSGGNGYVMFLNCKRCGFLSGNVLTDFKLHFDLPPSTTPSGDTPLPNRRELQDK
jgi:hypothetical protein